MTADALSSDSSTKSPLVATSGGANQPLTLNAGTRVKLGSVLLQEGLLPQCGFFTPLASPQQTIAIDGEAELIPASQQSSDVRYRMYVATRAGSLSLYSLLPPGVATSPSTDASHAPRTDNDRTGGDWQALLARDAIHACRRLSNFLEKKLSPREFSVDDSSPAEEADGAVNRFANVNFDEEQPPETPKLLSEVQHRTNSLLYAPLCLGPQQPSQTDAVRTAPVSVRDRSTSEQCDAANSTSPPYACASSSPAARKPVPAVTIPPAWASLGTGDINNQVGCGYN